MFSYAISFVSVGVIFLSAVPAQAAVAIPAPTDLGLFLLGIAGLVIGRQSAKRRGNAKDDGSA